MKKILLVAFDVTDLTEEQAEWVGIEASVQGEASDDHPDAGEVRFTVVQTETVPDEAALKALFDRPYCSLCNNGEDALPKQ